MEKYVLMLKNKIGEVISLEGIALTGVHFPEVPLGGEKITLHDSPELIEYFKKRASPFEELQKRFSERTYVIKGIKFGERNIISAVEEIY
jgi:hypothetical protein